MHETVQRRARRADKQTVHLPSDDNKSRPQSTDGGTEEQSMEQTANFGLNQWAKADRIQMEDFNSDNSKLDAALKSHADALATKLEAADLQWVTLGTVTGDNSLTVSNVENYRMFHLIFKSGSFNYSAQLHWGGKSMDFILESNIINSSCGLLELIPLPLGGIFMRYNTYCVMDSKTNDVFSARVNAEMAVSGTVSVSLSNMTGAGSAFTLYGLKK